MNLVQADALSYSVSRLTYGEVLANLAVKAWMNEAEKNQHVQALKLEIERLNTRRSNIGQSWLPTHVFYLLEFDAERHARNKTEKNKWERLQVRASLALGVPCKESFLPWMIYQTLNDDSDDDRSVYDRNMEFCARCD